MFCLFLISSIVALNVGRYTFPVEQLIANTTSYSVEFEDEMFYFNYLNPVIPPSQCYIEFDSVALADEGIEFCIPVGLLDTVQHSLIQDTPSSQPKGVRTTYKDEEGDVSITFDVVCNRVEKRIVQRSPTYEYLVTWQHPAGCPRLSSRLDRVRL
ncbi:hypothetical protein BLNAU_6959 [Blattamonas nauphoetae]|uniref:Uncharacterized protein n=1 Tax=Blattamonas nauphoetae TaxID=2049346 RepID=A0ABQ9Y2R4_9EUKA|nr:hypothetical protein BLNAU_6959 [Blattamonas nauphoetae]